MEVSKNTPAIGYNLKRKVFFYNRQVRREPSISGQRVTKSSFRTSTMKSFTIYHANSFIIIIVIIIVISLFELG